MDYRYRRMRQAVDRRLQKHFGCDYFEESEPLIEQAKLQVGEFLQGARRQFDLPLAFAGSEFQVKVWEALLEIPYGETRSYGQLAGGLG